MITLRLVFIWTLLFVYHVGSAQTYTRFQRKNERNKARLERAERRGKITPEEKAVIDQKQRKVDRTNKRAVRNGSINAREQARLDRNARKVKRETRRAIRN